MHSILLSTRRAALGALALACAALAAPAAWAQQKTVGITAIVEHPALDAIRKGAQDELRALGWSEDKLKVQYQSAQGSAATAGQIAKKFAGDKVDAIIAIATPSAQAAAAATRSIPIIYAAVTDPQQPGAGQALAAELGWHAERSLNDMMRDSWRWQSGNPNGYGD